MFENKNYYKFHKPVLLQEVIEYLDPKDNEIYADCTFGAGGYSRAMLEKAKCKVYALDKDSNVIKFSNPLKKEFGYRFKFINSPFSELKNRMNELGITGVDAVILDLGVSSMQLDEKSRGFSFNSNSKLDMRMDPNNNISAYEIVNEMPESELSRIIKEFGEERKSKEIAKNIVKARNIQTIETASQLAAIVRNCFTTKQNKTSKIDTATRTFQAIRICVNNELEELKQVLQSSISLLNKGGRLITISFHSLEDSIVKNFLRKESGYNDRNISRYQPLAANNNKSNFSLVKKSVIKPKIEEIKENNRSRSAHMRVAIKM